MIKIFWLIVYYGFAKHLPKSTVPIVGAMAKALRRSCAKHLFAQCGSGFNLEQGAYIGNGRNFYVGKNVGIGKDFVCHSRIVTIHDGLLMAENVLFQGGGIPLRILINLLVLNQTKDQHHWRFVVTSG